ncbi:MAG: IclR family transcriptional regulator [Pseudomonadota bacterium]
MVTTLNRRGKREGNAGEDDGRIATNLRTLLIIETIAKSGVPLSPTEINAHIGLPKQSIHRLCQTLVDEGFLIRDVSGKRLHAAPRTMDMARGLFTNRQMSAARRAILLELSERTGETVNFVLPEPDGMTYLDRVETDWLFRIELPIGSRVPFHCTASGKCYLASLETRQLNSLINTLHFEARTPNTITTPEALVKELAQVRQQGFAVDHEELFEGMIALAVPVEDAQGRFMAAIAFHGPTLRLTRDGLMDHLNAMRDGAGKLARL